jgi:hypothetical protein
MLLWIVYRGIRLHGVEGWLAQLPVLLFGVGRFRMELTSFGISLFWFPPGAAFTIGNIASLLLGLVLGLLLMRRLYRSLERQRLIKSEYRPTLEVGGDFFQIVPHPTDGSLNGPRRS